MRELTPKHLRCGLSDSCPAVFRVEDGRDELLIVGRVPSVETIEKVGARIGPGELAIVIPAEYFNGLAAMEFKKA